MLIECVQIIKKLLWLIASLTPKITINFTSGECCDIHNKLVTSSMNEGSGSLMWWALNDF